jgi:hypothetical protein
VPTTSAFQLIDYSAYSPAAAIPAKVQARRELPDAADFAEPFTVR